jgi:hypothetical protein
MHFTTGADEQKGRNLRADDRVLLQVGGLDWKGGLDVVVEGRATLVTDPAVLASLAAAWRRRWDGRWGYQLRGGGLRHMEGGPDHPDGFPVLTYSVRPDRVLAFAEGKFGHTRHTF